MHNKIIERSVHVNKIFKKCVFMVEQELKGSEGVSSFHASERVLLIWMNEGGLQG